jgi:hypothetical protein
MRQIVTFVLVETRFILQMIKKIKELYKEFKPYVRVDLIMYGVLILLIVLYFIFSLAW